MAKRFHLKQLFLLFSVIGVISFCQGARAAAFQLWEQDAASIGNYHAGTAAIADDASTAWYNPAGMIRIKNQQAILGTDAVLTNFLFRGTVNNHALTSLGLQTMTAQGGGNFNFVPFLHYVAPISDRIIFGMSIDVPFGLETNYGNNTFVRYAATLTQLQVIDYTPSLAVAITDKLSVGVGVDFQRLSAEIDLNGAVITTATNSISQNKAHSWGQGYRLGALYQFTPQTRIGINFHSKVTHHVNGTSKLIGPLANDVLGGVQYSPNFKASATLPSITSFSVFHTINSLWDVMGSVSYVQWNVFKNLVLQNVAGIADGVSTNALVVIIPEHYKNAWNYAVGANYHPNEKWIVRTGVGYDQSPTQDAYRNLQLPDSDRIAFAVGAHYQLNKTIGFDAGWTHIFAMNTRINNLTQAFGDQLTTTNGSVSGSADVYGLQMKWDMF